VDFCFGEETLQPQYLPVPSWPRGWCKPCHACADTSSRHSAATALELMATRSPSRRPRCRWLSRRSSSELPCLALPPTSILTLPQWQSSPQQPLCAEGLVFSLKSLPECLRRSLSFCTLARLMLLKKRLPTSKKLTMLSGCSCSHGVSTALGTQLSGLCAAHSTYISVSEQAV
jgi:hypothetical protein